MTPHALLAECRRVTEQGLTHLVLTVPVAQRRASRSGRVRVMPGVLGELLCVNSDDRLVVRCAIADVVRGLERATAAARKEQLGDVDGDDRDHLP